MIVIGASEGGVEPLKTIASTLPEHFTKPIFVVVPVIGHDSALVQLLSGVGPLDARYAEQGEVVQQGTIYIAPPDMHMLLLQRGTITLSAGAKVNRTRPAIDPLFRSAAQTYAAEVTGVILSGNLDDGVLGLAEIKRMGGTVIAQDPRTAVYPSMPSCAIQSLPVDYVVRAEDVSGLLTSAPKLWTDGAPPSESTGQASDLTCPECSGPITKFEAGTLVEYRCRTGHAYTALTFAAEYHSKVQRKLWEAVVTLEHAAQIADQLSLQFGEDYKRQANDRRQQASVIQDLLNDITPAHRRVAKAATG
ncbi:MAG: chemotaxis protein CheB [Acidobacteriaceae bacterium]|nr:chemotaxis protein CheB [Acidobacteriaceae bacterium]